MPKSASDGCGVGGKLGNGVGSGVGRCVGQGVGAVEDNDGIIKGVGRVFATHGGR